MCYNLDVFFFNRDRENKIDWFDEDLLKYFWKVEIIGVFLNSYCDINEEFW